MKLEGKIAIVTGAGKGIGREVALAIAEEGATVVAVARTQADLDETVKMIEEKGGKAVSLSRDVYKRQFLNRTVYHHRDFGKFQKILSFLFIQ